MNPGFQTAKHFRGFYELVERRAVRVSAVGWEDEKVAQHNTIHDQHLNYEVIWTISKEEDE